jgi:hypothetical protein
MHAVSHRSVGPYRIEQTGDEVVFQLVRPAWSPLRFNLFYAATLGLVCLAGAAYEARGWESLHFAALTALTVAWATGYIRLVQAVHGGKLRRVRDRVARYYRKRASHGYRETSRIAAVAFDGHVVPEDHVRAVYTGEIISTTEYGSTAIYPVYVVCRDMVFVVAEPKQPAVAGSIAQAFAQALDVPCKRVFGNPVLRGGTMAMAVVGMLLEMFWIAVAAIYGLINYEPTMAAAGLAVSMGLLNAGLVWLARTYLRPRADEKVREMFGIA